MRAIRLLGVMSACFACIALDNSKLVAALPSLARASDASPALQRWVVEAGLLVYASLLLLGGSLCERFGPRRLLLFGLAGFAGASLAGAMTHSLYALIATRALDGAATACVTPATLATLKHTFDESERPRAIAIWTASFGIGAALGPLLAGLLVTHGGITAVLLANLPPIALCAWGTWRLVSADLPRHAVPLDWRGALLCLLGAACSLFAFLSGPSQGWGSAEVLVPGALGALLLGTALVWLRRARHPLFDLSLFSGARFSRALLVILLGYFAFSGVSFVIAQHLQLGRAKAAFEAGLLTLPLPLSMLLGTLTAPNLMSRLGAERALGTSLTLGVLGAVGLAFASRGTADWLLCLALMPFGAGCGSAFANATELTLGAVAPERAASAAAISESAFEFGGVLGVAVLSTLLGASALAPEALQLAGQRAFWAGALALLLAWSVAASLLVQRNP